MKCIFCGHKKGAVRIGYFGRMKLKIFKCAKCGNECFVIDGKGGTILLKKR